MNERPTPESDKAKHIYWANGRTSVLLDTMERLERERDEAREKLRDFERRNHDTNRKLSDALAELEDWRNAAKGAENPCPDEKHCTCVPLLHKMLRGAREAFAIVTDQLVQEQIKNRRLRKALTACMDIIGPPESLSDECWKTTDEINTAWNAGKEALKA